MRYIPGIRVHSRIDSFETETLAIVDTMTSVTIERQRLINNLVRGLKDDGLSFSSIFDAYYVMAHHTNDNGEAQINWVNPGTFDLINVNNTPFTGNQGFGPGDGATQYLRTQYNPSTDAINYTQNDAGYGIYSGTNVVEGALDIGGKSTYWSLLALRYTGDIYSLRINNNNAMSAASTDSKGYFIVSRTASDVAKLYRNKILEIDGNESSNGIADIEMYILCYNNNGVASNFSTKQISHAFISKGMTQTNVNNATDRFETFADSVGFGVI